ncbi:MAG: DUF262 domain-containing protein [Bacilli bacterium]|nr:DUF262 domain-containing protein [Bacilli bacterium]MDD4808506.1 DUF262 domain-containing protein [Bacilli bacterium]
MNNLLSLTDLFSRCIFRIPDYQRGYSWGDLQLEEFWSDILNLLQEREHYTGMISLKKLDGEYTGNEKWNDERWLLDKWRYEAYHVVDGQQRLTTFIILINEIVEFYEKLYKDKGLSNDKIFINSIPLSKIKEDYLYINRPDSDDIIKTYKFGYEVDNPSYEFFKCKILGAESNGQINETFYTLNLENAKEFFETNLRILYDNKGLAGIEEVFEKVTQKLMFNMYYIDNDFNVFMAFETMNNRGKRLSNLELLKNRLIYLSTIFDKAEDIKNRVRKNINTTWKNVYGYLGQNKSKPLNDDDFLQDHWIIYFGYSRSNKDNYSTFLLNEYFTQQNISDKYIVSVKTKEEEIDETQENIELDISEEIEELETEISDKKEKLTLAVIDNYINSMKNLIPYWYDIQNPAKSKLNKDIIEILSKLNRLGFVYFKPLIAVLISQENISNEKKLECLKKIERYIFLHFRLVNYSSTYRNSFFWNLSHRLYVNEVDIDYVIEEVSKIDYLSDNKVANMNGILNNINRWFKNYKGYYSWNSIKYFLYEYELYLMNDQANQKIYPENLFKKDEKDKISVEHIYPQTDTDVYWINRFDNYSDDERKNLNGSLGNLLPLSLSINIKLQNYSFDEKKMGRDRVRGYSNGSHSEMKVANNLQWTPNEILDRGLEMIKFMEEEWDFIVPNKADRIKMLGLDFMIQNDDHEIDKTESYNKEKVNEQKTKFFDKEGFKRLSLNAEQWQLDVYNILDEYCMDFSSNIFKNTTKHYIAWSNGKVFFEFHFMSNFIKCFISAGDYDDLLHKVVRLGDNYNWTNNNRLDIYLNDDIEYIKNIVKQSYEKTLK